jgi:hypothetical protein
LALTIAAVVLLASALWAPAASAEFGPTRFDVTFTNEDGSPATQAGSHPFAVTTTFELAHTGEFFEAKPDGNLKDLITELVDGLAGDATAMPQCDIVDFLNLTHGIGSVPHCADATAVGAVGANVVTPPPSLYIISSIFNLEPVPGTPVRLGFVVLGVPVIVGVKVKPEADYNIVASSLNTPQEVPVYGGVLQLWGNPADPAHDHFRGKCLTGGVEGEGLVFSGGEVDFGAGAVGNCTAGGERKPLLTLPGSCRGPQEIAYEMNSWWEPAKWVLGSVLTHDDAQPPNLQGFTGCGKLGFAPEVETVPTTDVAEAGTGLDFNVDFNDEGLTAPNGLAESTAEKAVVTLPEGVTINPSIGEGLGVCEPGDYDRETLDSAPGAGCPNSSKIGTLHLETPVVDESIEGSVYLAQQDDPGTTEPGAENPFDSLIALYLVLRNPNLGAMVKQPLKVEPDPQTGRLVATLEDVPQVPFSHFNFHFREGQRAALVTPSACGTYTTEAKFYPWSDPTNPRVINSSFEITKGKDGGPCPPGGVPPFAPDFEAGSINNNAGSFSPFNMRLIREDGEQDMTKFSAVLPPGVLGSLAGVSKCPDSAIAVARSKTGRQELVSPSCPASSQIGHTLAGAGVGSALTYVGGQIYLGGPYNGDPLSVISVTPAVAGPFDAGTVVVRLALTLNPKTAEVEVDGANSDPIPHILKGIVLKVRDLRVYVDRPNFTLNPTSCDESSARSVLFGSYLDVLSPLDDRPVDLATRYQAANCLNLGFKPKLALNLKGGTKRGGHPGLRAIYTPKKGDANVKGLVVRLPRSAFLDQGHIKTICTRVQFAAKACPKASQYGYIKAWTPLLETPLEGPVYLRSSNHKLPDLVFDLHGLVDIEVATRIDSKGGGIRATVENAPDAPLTKVDLRMQGAKKGLIINSRNLCGRKSKANVLFTGHNGKEFSSKPVMKADCGGKRKGKR